MEMINGTFWSRGTVSINQVPSWKTLSHTPLVALYWLLSAPSSSECWGWGSQFEDISWSWGGEWLEVNLQQQERIGNIHQRYWLIDRQGFQATVCKKRYWAICDNFGGNKHIFWLNLEQKKLFNNIWGATTTLLLVGRSQYVSGMLRTRPRQQRQCCWSWSGHHLSVESITASLLMVVSVAVVASQVTTPVLMVPTILHVTVALWSSAQTKLLQVFRPSILFHVLCVAWKLRNAPF